MGKDKESPQASTVVSVQFRFEHRDKHGKLVTCSENLKGKTTLKDRLKRMISEVGRI